MQCNAFHDSHDVFYRSPFGAVACGQKIVFRLQTQLELSVETCLLRLWEGGREKLLPMSKVRLVGTAPQDIDIFEVEYVVPDNPGLVWYYFIFRIGSVTHFYGNNAERYGGEGKVWEEEPPAYQITVHHPMSIPAWFREGIMYQIFVDRFFNGNEKGEILCPRQKTLIHADWYDTPIYIKDEKGRVVRWDFFGGNLKGVIEKLPYLKELGISILYFNPIFEASSNHKYDTADYLKIDPMYGDLKSLEILVREAKRKGMSILLDGVFSHTGSNSIYFNKNENYPGQGAYQSPDSPYYPWYKWKEDGGYTCWWGVEDLPEVNELDPTYQEFIFQGEDSVVQTWMKKGVRGWRLDVADELPDEFIKELRKTMRKADPDALLIGEVWEDASNKESYGKLREYFWGHELDSTMNYPFREIFLQFLLGQIDASRVHQKVMSLYENYPRENFFAAMNLIGSHDRARVLTLLGEAPPAERLSTKEQETFRLTLQARQLAFQRLKLLTLIQMSFPGVPCVYYGDEAGLEGYADPYNRGTYPWGREDLEILEWYKRILRFRQEYDVLLSGDFFSFSAGEDVYGFRRVGENEEIIILINRHPSEAREVELTLDAQPISQVIDLFEGKLFRQGEIKEVREIRVREDRKISFDGNDDLLKSSLRLAPLTGKALFCQKAPMDRVSFVSEDLSRSCGVLMHISSLPSPWGIGDLGEEAYQFVNFLAESGQSLWQVLPLNPVGLGDSPYQSDSAFAGNPLFISIDHLIREGLLTREEAQSKYTVYRCSSLDGKGFSWVKGFKMELLHLAYSRFTKLREKDMPKYSLCQCHSELDFHVDSFKNSFNDSNADLNQGYLSLKSYQIFQEENKDWLKDYALYQSLKSTQQGLPWYEWVEGYASRAKDDIAEYEKHYAEEIAFHTFVQYTFEYEWQELKKYAHEKGIKIIGDMPIFVATDSCDTWVNREFFALDKKNRPLKVAGVPPDYFSPTGQLWGNPVYNWDFLAASNYSWWMLRIKQALKRFDILRLDHFRGFEAYWEVPAEEKTAEKGRWMKGPGKRFFESLIKELGPLPLIVEDLGNITPEVNALKLIFGFPGMKVLQFTPLEQFAQEATTDCVYYSGTHDNDTLLGWYKTEHNHKKLKTRNVFIRKEIERLYQSQAAWVILPLQDILGLDSDARMNIPGTIEGNWHWRVEKDSLTSEIRVWLRALAKKYKRATLINKQ